VQRHIARYTGRMTIPPLLRLVAPRAAVIWLVARVVDALLTLIAGAPFAGRWEFFDGYYYSGIVDHGYWPQDPALSAYFALYPLLVRAVMSVTPELVAALLAVFLVALSGFTRYHPQHKTVEDERAQLERDLELEPLCQRVRVTKATGVATLAKATIGALGRTPGTYPPTGPGSPSSATASDDRTEATLPAQGLRRASDGTASVEAKARGAYTAGMSVAQLQKAAGISRGSAMKWLSTLRAETEAQGEIAS